MSCCCDFVYDNGTGIPSNPLATYVYEDLTGLGAQDTVVWGQFTTAGRWIWDIPGGGDSRSTHTVPQARVGDIVVVNLHGLFNEFPLTPAQRRWSARVVVDGTIEIAFSGGPDTVTPTPCDWILFRNPI